MSRARRGALAALVAAGCYSQPTSIPCIPCSDGPCASGTQCSLGYCLAPGEDPRRCPAIPLGGTASASTTTRGATSSATGATGMTGTTGTTVTATTIGTATGTASTSSSGGAAGTSGSPVTLSCAFPGGGTSLTLLADTPVVVTCMGPSGGVYTPTSTSSLLQLANDLEANGTLTVTLPSSALPLGFTETAATLTIAHSSGLMRTLDLDLEGNLLVGGAGVVALASNGVGLGTLITSAAAGSVTLLGRLEDGTLLVGSADLGLQVFDLSGNPVSAFDAVDGANDPLFGGDLAPWGAATDPSGNIWVSRNSPSMPGQDAVLVFSGSGTYLTMQSPPGDIGSTTWLPLGVAQLADGTMAVANGGYPNAPVVALYPPTGTPVSVMLGFEACTDPGDGTPDCSGPPQSFGTAAGLLIVDGGVLVSTQEGMPLDSFVGAFTNPGLSFIRSTARVSPTTDYGIVDTAGLATLADDGVYVVAAQSADACLLALDPTTLYFPSGWSDASGCFPPNVSPPARPVVLHLGP